MKTHHPFNLSLVAGLALSLAASGADGQARHQTLDASSPRKYDVPGDRPPTRPMGPVLVPVPVPVQGPCPLPATKDPAKVLQEHGPQFSPAFRMGGLHVEAFAKGGWPLVIAYELPPASIGLLSVTAGNVEFLYRLRPGRYQEIIRSLPAAFGPSPVIATYSVRAFSDGLGPQASQPVPFRIYALGAGDRAVGSVGIEELRFSPAAIRPAAREKASYSFRPKYDFRKAAAEFVRLESLQNQTIAYTVDEEEFKDVVRGRPSGSTWDGKAGDVAKKLKEVLTSAALERVSIQAGRPSFGRHVLQVRAWMGAREGDWVMAWSDDAVQVQP